MSAIPANQVIKCVVHGTLDAQQTMNVLYFHKATPTVPADVAAILAAVDTMWANFTAAQLGSGYNYVSTTAQDISVLTNPTSTIIRSPIVPGGVASQALPGNSAPVVTKRTALSGRSNRGRIYIPGIPTNGTATASSLSTSKVSGLLSSLSPLVGDILVAGLFHAVVSFFSGVTGGGVPIPRVSGLATHVNALSMDTSIDSQRRRLIGRGF